MRLAAFASLLALLAAAPAGAATRSCPAVTNPYPGSRYEGADLDRIRATGVSCRTARQVVRRGHARAFAGMPDANGIVRATWNGWRIRGDLKPSRDTYVATRGNDRVTWRF